MNLHQRYRAVREAFEASGKGSKQAEKVAAKSSSTVSDAVKERHYGDISKEHSEAADNLLRNAEQNGIAGGMSIGDRASFQGSVWKGNLQNKANEKGQSVLGMMGKQAAQGAVWGAGIGGTTEALQGGSFWDGAKSGAFKGAALHTGIRTAHTASGATQLNPFGKNGMLRANQDIWNLGSKNANVSKQAASILRQRNGDGVARAVMNRNSAK